ncbi:hypothetical protein AVEN_94841-1 [Araneus ventricosus]|uniref:Uncharacterized protein n=1 Tax=Araneus ventricosus TaxID=182803 RepID=A0A4Y2CME8_ARAVE|nr:hypothetical protein AVEN_94841-1 [Araneus ventricosus]
MELFRTVPELGNLFDFYHAGLKNVMVRDDYRELIELSNKRVLLAVCLFIVTIYVKPWLQFILAVKAPYKDLSFLKSLKAYENVNESM